MKPVLLIAADLAGDPALPDLLAQLRLRTAAWSLLTTTPTPKILLQALRETDAEAARSWLATRDPALAQTAATAGMGGIVVVGRGTEGDPGIPLRYSPDVPGITIAMVPRGGGCWHA